MNVPGGRHRAAPADRRSEAAEARCPGHCRIALVRALQSPSLCAQAADSLPMDRAAQARANAGRRVCGGSSDRTGSFRPNICQFREKRPCLRPCNALGGRALLAPATSDDQSGGGPGDAPGDPGAGAGRDRLGWWGWSGLAADAGPVLGMRSSYGYQRLRPARLRCRRAGCILSTSTRRRWRPLSPMALAAQLHGGADRPAVRSLRG